MLLSGSLAVLDSSALASCLCPHKTAAEVTPKVLLLHAIFHPPCSTVQSTEIFGSCNYGILQKADQRHSLQSGASAPTKPLSSAPPHVVLAPCAAILKPCQMQLWLQTPHWWSFTVPMTPPCRPRGQAIQVRRHKISLSESPRRFGCQRVRRHAKLQISLCVADSDTLRVSSHIFHLLILFQGLPLVSCPVRPKAATWGEVLPQLPSPFPLDAASKHCSLGCSMLKHTFGRQRRQHGLEEDLELFGSAWLELPASVSSICIELRPLGVAHEKAKVSPHPHSTAFEGNKLALAAPVLTGGKVKSVDRLLFSWTVRDGSTLCIRPALGAQSVEAPCFPATVMTSPLALQRQFTQ